ncbi:hypothetical protein AZZ73_002801 [Klebsiella pneumoniae]|nr:hypothetical protein AZZ73_002801 [Klebsiella pneumoniae]
MYQLQISPHSLENSVPPSSIMVIPLLLTYLLNPAYAPKLFLAFTCPHTYPSRPTIWFLKVADSGSFNSALTLGLLADITFMLLYLFCLSFSLILISSSWFSYLSPHKGTIELTKNKTNTEPRIIKREAISLPILSIYFKDKTPNIFSFFIPIGRKELKSYHWLCKTSAIIVCSN